MNQFECLNSEINETTPLNTISGDDYIKYTTKNKSYITYRNNFMISLTIKLRQNINIVLYNNLKLKLN